MVVVLQLHQGRNRTLNLKLYLKSYLRGFSYNTKEKDRGESNFPNSFYAF